MAGEGTMTEDQKELQKILTDHDTEMDTLSRSFDERNQRIRVEASRGNWNGLDKIVNEESAESEVGDGSEDSEGDD
jgi:hypothetical protein